MKSELKKFKKRQKMDPEQPSPDDIPNEKDMPKKVKKSPKPKNNKKIPKKKMRIERNVTIFDHPRENSPTPYFYNNPIDISVLNSENSDLKNQISVLMREVIQSRVFHRIESSAGRGNSAQVRELLENVEVLKEECVKTQKMYETKCEENNLKIQMINELEMEKNQILLEKNTIEKELKQAKFQISSLENEKKENENRMKQNKQTIIEYAKTNMKYCESFSKELINLMKEAMAANEKLNQESLNYQWECIVRDNQIVKAIEKVILESKKSPESRKLFIATQASARIGRSIFDNKLNAVPERLNSVMEKWGDLSDLINTMFE